MQQIKFIITTLSPILISSNSGDPNLIGTYTYIPARAIRGCLAREYIKRFQPEDAHRDEKFFKWFLSGELRFTDATILLKNQEKLYETYPIPFSIQREKNGDGIYNLLLEDKDLQTLSFSDVYGYVDKGNIYLTTVKKSINFHHARNRKTGSSEEGKIFNYESIEPDQSFGGWIIGNDKDIEEFLKIFSDGIYNIGRSRNNQYGKAKIEFNKNFQSTTKPEKLKPGLLYITFLSDTIIYNEYGYSVVDVRRLENIIRCPVKRSFIKKSEIENFISVWGVKTPSDVCFKAGSSFLIEVPDEERLNALLELQKKGIGERTEEGFGRFHLGFLDEENLTEIRPTTKPKLPDVIPGIVSDIIREAIKSQAIELIKREAILNLKDKIVDYKKLTSSFVSRLLLMLKDSEDLEGFNKKLKELARSARNKLEDTSLYEVLEGFKIEECIKGDLRALMKSEILKKIYPNPFEDSEFKERLAKAYLETFLRILLKEVKKEKK